MKSFLTAPTDEKSIVHSLALHKIASEKLNKILSSTLKLTDKNTLIKNLNSLFSAFPDRKEKIEILKTIFPLKANYFFFSIEDLIKIKQDFPQDYKILLLEILKLQLPFDRSTNHTKETGMEKLCIAFPEEKEDIFNALVSNKNFLNLFFFLTEITNFHSFFPDLARKVLVALIKEKTDLSLMLRSMDDIITIGRIFHNEANQFFEYIFSASWFQKNLNQSFHVDVTRLIQFKEYFPEKVSLLMPLLLLHTNMNFLRNFNELANLCDFFPEYKNKIIAHVLKEKTLPCSPQKIQELNKKTYPTFIDYGIGDVFSDAIVYMSYETIYKIKYFLDLGLYHKHEVLLKLLHLFFNRDRHIILGVSIHTLPPTSVNELQILDAIFPEHRDLLIKYIYQKKFDNYIRNVNDLRLLLKVFPTHKLQLMQHILKNKNDLKTILSNEEQISFCNELSEEVHAIKPTNPLSTSVPSTVQLLQQHHGIFLAITIPKDPDEAIPVNPEKDENNEKFQP